MSLQHVHSFAKGRWVAPGPDARRICSAISGEPMALALYLGQHKQALYNLFYHTEATLSDHRIDIDGGIGTVFVFGSKGAARNADGQVYPDGEVEQLGRKDRFVGQHICTPGHGVAMHINAFNFPVWGMLEKLAPTLLGGWQRL